MSIRYGQKTSSISDRRLTALAHNRDTTFNSTVVEQNRWVRPSEWLTITSPLSSEQKVILLVEVYNNQSNLLAFKFTGNYTVDWGDGSAPENVASTVIASHEYIYSSIPSSPLSDSTKQVIVTITPNGAANLTAISLAEAHPFKGPVTTDNYSQYILEAYISLPNLNAAITGLGNASANFDNGILNTALINVELINIGSLTTFQSLFLFSNSLRRVNITANTSAITSVSNMFRNCRSLTDPPFFNTSNVTNFSEMFNVCTSLITCPAYNTLKATSVNAMFANCPSLQRIPDLSLPVCNDYANMFLSCTSLEIGPNISMSTSSGVSATLGSMFFQCENLKNVPLYNTIRVTNMQQMFQNCYSISSIPLFDTRNVTNMSTTFGGCRSLKTVPLFNTSNVTSMQSMFSDCTGLEAVPLFNTSRVTNFTFMFINCHSLEKVPVFSLEGLGNSPPSVNISHMFRLCRSLKEAPAFNTERVTGFGNVFQGCRSLEVVPHYNTLSATGLAGMEIMFEECMKLRTVPFFETRNVRTMATMFANCFSLTGIPPFDTSRVTSMATMFQNCHSLKTIPELNTGLVTTFNNMFNGCRTLNTVSLCAASVTDTTSMFVGCESLATARLSGLTTNTGVELTHLSKEALEEFFFYLGLGTAKTIILTTSYGAKRYPAITVNSVTTTAGSVSATTTLSTSALSAGMQITGLTVNTGPPINSPISVTFTDATDTVGLTSHGLQNGDKVSFSTITTTTGISTFTIYYVINKTDNDFQIALTPGGSAISLTNNGTGTMRYNALITEIKVGLPNTIIFNRPMTVTGTNNQSFRFLVTGDALLRNWSIIG